MASSATSYNPSREDFAAMLDESFAGGNLQESSVIKGKVVAIEKDMAVIDVGLKTEGRVALREFNGPGRENDVKVGDEVEVFLDRIENALGEAVLSRDKARREESWGKLEKAFNNNEKVHGVIFNQVKGGFTVDLDGAVAFLPRSQVDIRPIRDVAPLMNNSQPFQILKMDRRRGNIVVSRRTVLEETRAEQRQELVQNLEEGQIIDGVVKNITDYGAFVDLGGIDGLLHVTDIAWRRVNHPTEVLTIGQTVKVKIIKINHETHRISLGMKQLLDDPWQGIEAKYPLNSRFTGRVTNITDYGAFVELEPGVEGLIHVSEMSWTKKVKHPSKLLEVGQEIDCQVLEVDAKAKRISLGLKQLEPDPWTLFTEKYSPGDKIGGKVRSITDYGVFIGIEEGVDGMVHKSDLSWTAKVNNPADLHHKGDDVEAIILSINHDEKKVSLGIKQLWDDPWPTIFSEFPPGKIVDTKVVSVVDYGVFVRIREGVEGLLPSNELVEKKNEAGEVVPFEIGDAINAEIANVDSQDRRLTLSMRIGEAASAPKPEKQRASVAPKKASDEQKATSIGELIKQKLGQVSVKGAKTEAKEEAKTEAKEEAKDEASPESKGEG